VEVLVPPDQAADVNGFIGQIGGLRVTPDVRAKVIINERTGTIVVGSNVRLSRVALNHAGLSVVTSESPIVSQPAPFAERGKTVVVPRTDMKVNEEKRPISVLDDTATVGDLARALNALGVTPRDLSSILQMLKESGSLHADLEVK
jgi:flagellar P-ring protein precursor FlgI